MGTETPAVWKEAQEWAKLAGWDLKFNPIQKDLWAAKSWDVDGDQIFDIRHKNRPKLDQMVGMGILSKVDPQQKMCYSYVHMYQPTFTTVKSDRIMTPKVVTTKTSPLALRF